MSHIHPWYPVVDVSEFLSRYKSDVPSQSDLMLLWSVLLAGIEVRYHAPLLLRPFFFHGPVHGAELVLIELASALIQI